MFGNIFSMMGNYEDRKVARYDDEAGVVVSTARVTDSQQPYETAIKHPAYNDGKHVIVELYDTEEEALVGHNRWVGRITADVLPKRLVDVSSSGVAEFCDVAGNDWRSNPES